MKTRDELIDDLLTLAFAEDVGDEMQPPYQPSQPKKQEGNNS